MVVGESGLGKSTLVRQLGGVARFIVDTDGQWAGSGGHVGTDGHGRVWRWGPDFLKLDFFARAKPNF